MLQQCELNSFGQAGRRQQSLSHQFFCAYLIMLGRRRQWNHLRHHGPGPTAGKRAIEHRQ